MYLSMEKPNISILTDNDKVGILRQVFSFAMDRYDFDDPYIINYLLDNEYFTAPASTRFHGNYPGGLFEHSYYVGHVLSAYTERLGLNWEREESPWVVGLLHDLCKIDLYKRIDDESNYDGETKSCHYEYSNEPIISGHAEKSLIYALRHIDLTDEEIACIRYHMGAYEKNDWEGFDRAIRKYPNVLYTHMADMHASKIFGV